ncbi:ornithine carbamoyltransferase [Candidatus Vidania fulgoroideorum]
MNLIKFKNITKINHLNIIKYSFFFKKRRKFNPFLKKNIGIFFKLPSTRTKISFEIACKELGCNTIIIDEEKTQIKRGEDVKDTIKMLSIYLDLLIFRCKNNKEMEIYKKYINIPLINALTKNSHPTQIINDIFTIYEKKGNIKNKTILWIGKNNNVFKSLYEASKIFKFKIKKIHKYNKKTIKNLYKNCDVIMTDTWVSMGEKKVKCKLKIEKKYLKMANKNFIIMHCLPMYRNKEINEQILEMKNCIIWKQAKNKLFTSKAIIYFFLL